MEKRFLDKVKDNAAIRAWSETTHHEKGDSLAEGYVSELWDFTDISVTQNSLQDCFTFEKVDLVLTVEEYMALLQCSKIQVDRVYSRAVNVPTFLKKLVNITEMSEQWIAARIKQKGESKCIPWKNLKDVILAHPDTKKMVDVFASSMYGLVVFPKALRHVDEAVTNLFDRLDRGVTPIPTILAEIFRSLNACRRAGEGRFIGCAQLLLAWFHCYFWRDDISEEKWMAIFQNLREREHRMESLVVAFG
ncbi:hypothetical protein Goshw_015936 [Gossypium schwendimanii]|uniref:DUF7745 domain-containing protein n=3 Tax=Gossypium schwendimanii TaxID=34291 RepID=A0A7J9N7C7_GOSSC|nr:hypothetical protein [Gossypium schwendimanii]